MEELNKQDQHVRTEEQKAMSAPQGVSPLYGTAMDNGVIVDPDVSLLNDAHIQAALQKAMIIYEGRLEDHDYSSMTISSYSSAVNRFVDFLKLGDVVPDMNRAGRTPRA